jgi:hypothetical protein
VGALTHKGWETSQGRAISEREVGELFGIAYGKAATVKNAQSGFRKSGIFPFDRNIFTDEDFAGSEATDHPFRGNDQILDLDQATLPLIGMDSSTIAESSGQCMTEIPTTSLLDLGLATLPLIGMDSSTIAESSRQSISREGMSASHTTAKTNFGNLLCMNQNANKYPRTGRLKRKVCHAEVLTSSPYKRQLEMEGAAKKKIQRTPRTQVPVNKRQKRGSAAVEAGAKTASCNVDTTPCLFCQIPYNESSVRWWQCYRCMKWVCDSCACIDNRMSSTVVAASRFMLIMLTNLAYQRFVRCRPTVGSMFKFGLTVFVNLLLVRPSWHR